MKVLISTSTFAGYDKGPIRLLEQAGIEPVMNPFGRKLANEETVALFREHAPVGIIAGVEKLSRDVLSAAPDLKVISRVGTGWDNVDHAAAKELGIAVYRTPDAHVDAVVELAIGLILSVLRGIAHADRNVRKGEWKPIMGQLLRGKVVGLVGYGLVGRRMASVLAEGFGAEVAGYDPYVADAEWGGGCLKLRSLEELLKKADIVSLHVPGGEGVLIGAKEISVMKKGAVIINTARGGLVDEAALLDALRSNQLGGAGLDVYGSEPYGGPLKEVDNTVLTMHMGSYAKEARVRMEMEAVEHLLDGLRVKGVVR